MNDHQSKVETIKQEFDQLKPKLDSNTKSTTLQTLESQTLATDFWKEENTAKKILQEVAALREDLDQVSQFESKLKSLQELILLTQDDQSADTQSEIAKEINKLESLLQSIKVKSCLSGKYDRYPAILSIHPGQGGTEAMDWASMLERMYHRYFELKDFKFSLVDQVPGEEAGIKLATFMIESPYAYGYLKSESGTHRLVRLSPFNSDNLRQTSFAAVEVIPLIDKADAQIDINPDDLEWQFYRSGGKGGQNVNKVSTAVRLTHTPSGLTVTSSTQRYQEQNRKIALQLLEAKLWNQAQADIAAEKQNIKGDYQPPAWGTQIRSYVLHPYQLVKDTRTGHEVTDSQSVLDGNLESFVQAYLVMPS